MSRFARERRVFFFEEPSFENGQPTLRIASCPKTNVTVVTPLLPPGRDLPEIRLYQRELLSSLLASHQIGDYIGWYYTPMALEFSQVLRPRLTVYDCMDELSAFAGAPTAMKKNESQLFETADLVFTGGATLYESKRKQHSSVHLFPSSVDVKHFAQARSVERPPEDEVSIPTPRLGYAGVIDERMDLDLLREVAAARPNWQLVMLGPVVKIDPKTLPSARNIHYLGMRNYADLPAYFSGWDIGLLPFALNESTRFISPTKTPEYLAAGLRVVSTTIRDVVTPYGDLGFVEIANGPSEFIRACELLLESPFSKDFQARVDQFLSQSSWDKTWRNMNQLMEDKLAMKSLPSNNSSRVSRCADIVKGVSHV